jgi:manganese transport protein
MSKVLEIFLSILTAVGGFVEIGEMTFAQDAGSKFGFSLLWVVIVGTIGIMVFGEMTGRIAAVTEQPVFHVVRIRSGIRLGLLALFGSIMVNLMTCTAEIGGMAIILKLLWGGSYRLLIIVAFLFLVLSSWFIPFKWIERVFGLMGLLMVLYVLSAVLMKPDWNKVAAGMIPNIPHVKNTQEIFVWLFFIISFMSSIMLPYETYFYASGGIEDRWKPADISVNRTIIIIGFTLGGVVAAGLLMNGAELFQSLKIDPQLPGTSVLAASQTLKQFGLVGALLGMFFAFSGAAIETCFSGAYSIAQFFGWPWGKYRKPAGAPRFTVAWFTIFTLSMLIVSTGIDPVEIVEYAIVFSVIILPLSYFPVLMVAKDRQYMGGFANGKLSNTLGWFYLILLTICGVAAIPLLILTHGGKG